MQQQHDDRNPQEDKLQLPQCTAAKFASSVTAECRDKVEIDRPNICQKFFEILAQQFEWNSLLELVCCCRRVIPVSEAEAESDKQMEMLELGQAPEDLSVWDMPFGSEEQEAQITELRRLVHIDQELEAEKFSTIPNDLLTEQAEFCERAELPSFVAKKATEGNQRLMKSADFSKIQKAEIISS